MVVGSQVPSFIGAGGNFTTRLVWHFRPSRMALSIAPENKIGFSDMHPPLLQHDRAYSGLADAVIVRERLLCLAGRRSSADAAHDFGGHLRCPIRFAELPDTRRWTRPALRYRVANVVTMRTVE